MYFIQIEQFRTPANNLEIEIQDSLKVFVHHIIKTEKDFEKIVTQLIEDNNSLFTTCSPVQLEVIYYPEPNYSSFRIKSRTVNLAFATMNLIKIKGELVAQYGEKSMSPLAHYLANQNKSGDVTFHIKDHKDTD